MDILKQLNAEMRSPIQTQNHRTFPLTKLSFDKKDGETENFNNNNNLIKQSSQMGY